MSKRLRRVCAAVGAAVVLLGVAGADPAPKRPVWSTAIDSRFTDQWLSVRDGVVYTVRAQHVVALDLAHGAFLWQSARRVDGRPAIAGATIYAPLKTGAVALDRATGIERGLIHFGGRKVDFTTTAATAIADASGGETVISGFDGGLAPRWERRYHGHYREIADAGDNVALAQSRSDVIAFDARTGDVAAATNGTDALVGRDGRTLWFSIPLGGLKSVNLDTTQTSFSRSDVITGAVKVEGRTAIAVVDGRLSSLRLPDGTPSALHVDGRWVGGPANGIIFISRSDGTYAFRLRDRHAVRLVTNTSDARFLTADGLNAYFATNDGSIVVADLRGLAPLVRWPTACTFVEGVHPIPAGALVHCDIGTVSRLYAFHR